MKTNAPEAALNAKDNGDAQHRRKRARTNDKAEGDGIQDDDEDSDPEEDEENQVVPEYVLREMEAFEQGFNGLQGKFKLLDKIGAGTFSSVYKAIDLEHEQYDNTAWDYEMEKIPGADVSEEKTATTKLSDSEGGKVVALKRIYVTSSPDRIQNEIAILHDLSGHKNVVPLITAFRFMDQVIVVLPYFEHRDFREYYKTLPMDGIRCYFRALLKALMHVHANDIIHRDVKPSNFLYDVQRKTGMLVDFGLAQRQETVRPSNSTSAATGPTRTSSSSINAGARASTPTPTGPTTLSSTIRPVIRVNRAGTRGFRAPEILFRHVQQTVALDIWSVGVILLCFLSGRFPFFNSDDDLEALLEIAVVFGQREMAAVAATFSKFNIQRVHFVFLRITYARCDDSNKPSVDSLCLLLNRSNVFNHYTCYQGLRRFARQNLSTYESDTLWQTRPTKFAVI
ncbi:cell cycle protein kinase spo4 [Linnemannia elongata]|nr:cell cycle protein kinase spo4 [Linnemannia elongata]